MEHVVVHRTAYDPRVKFIDLVVAPNEQHVLVLCTDDKVALKHGSTSIQVQCKTVADYSLRVIPTVQASTNDTLYKTHEFAKLGSLIVEAQVSRRSLPHSRAYWSMVSFGSDLRSIFHSHRHWAWRIIGCWRQRKW
jgi:hypothetical protein